MGQTMGGRGAHPRPRESPGGERVVSLRDARIQVHRALTRGGVRFEVAVELTEALEAAVREDEREKRETGGSIPAVAPCWCGDPRGIFHVRDGHPPVLNKRS